MFEHSPQSISKSRQTAAVPRHPRAQASNQFMSSTSSNFKAMSSSTTAIDKPDTAKIPSIPQSAINRLQSAPMNPEDEQNSQIQSLSASSDLLAGEISRANESIRNMVVIGGKRFLSMDENSQTMDMTTPKSNYNTSSTYDIYQTQSPPQSKYAKKYQVENHVGTGCYSSSVIGGPLQRDEKEMLRLKKEEQRREMQQALQQQMEEKRQVKERELAQKRLAEQRELAMVPPIEFKHELSESIDSHVEFASPQRNAVQTIPTSPAPAMSPVQIPQAKRPFPIQPPRSPPKSLHALESPGPERYDSPTNQFLFTENERSQTVPDERDKSEECIEYLNALCHSLMEKQQTLQDKVVSQENEIKNLVETNQHMNSRVQGPRRAIPKSATAVPVRTTGTPQSANAAPVRTPGNAQIRARKTQDEKLKAMHEEQARKTKAIEDKINHARIRAENRKWTGRASVGPSNPPRAQTQQQRPQNYTPKSLPPRPAALTPNTSNIHQPSASISRATLPIFNFDPRDDLDSAGTSQLIYPGESGLFTDELDKFMKSNNISQREEAHWDINSLRDPPGQFMEASFKSVDETRQNQKHKFPREVFRAFRN